ncbi:PP2C family protein-serine/threonine phosphatase [Hyalangium rubrum]|uniref:Protein phosphatase 2C domain-containing protein n=1 Tax=Hyalangium rubrum TaxID=3103134 RepID=A0ABU5H8W4_9BACT|nr:protein phosphatase 2C domain-containing protein [Hyalangium sp. s54d21]MDY7229288.1 protein phosphatase 2C domain-containing protein [Hyalangium sp. s54d21]
MRLESAGQTHVGRRPHNEDAYCVRPELGLFVVADGLGGQEGGEVASQCVVDAFKEFGERMAREGEAAWPHPQDGRRSREENLLAVCTELAQRAVQSRRVGYLREMGSTVVAFAVGEGGAAVSHVGDSRLYRLREGQLEALTRDHSITEELREAGLEPPPRGQSAFGHIITRALGTERSEPTVHRVELRAGDVYLLCSDGLYEPLGPERMATSLALSDVAQACAALVSGAYEAGSRDNITAVVVRILEA